ncbi:MbnP family protein [Filimonas effusa]|uniref:Copper-binding protein MbnP-like domain-containing protein n=1 Tax=Filimonas effusa TaxID=2508721 RepID=A0A4Q1D8B4_9BACT|nr:MbnP family protein [Filimonas effusa]RXK85567.1 hypothetical protein ESB13_01760 [Filimonas effusa]
MIWNPLIGKYGSCIMAALLFAGTLQAQAKSFLLQFRHRVGTAPLVKDSVYANSFAEPFSVHSFKYYISHIQALDAAGKKLEALSGKVFLVDQSDTASTRISLAALPAGTVSVRFLLGVDSTYNTAGVLTGTLDPLNGMFWTWNSGYIMAKLEGRSPASKAPGNYYTYHVGGYKPGQQTARWITLPVNNRQTLYVAANVLKWFNGKHDIMIAAQPVCHAPGSLAVLLADNYAEMFSVINEP